jgi:inosine-uridine nucleoside N-ribohydrolase
MERIPVLLDTDIGSDIDDAVALAYLMAQERCDLAGITTVTGDTGKRAALAEILCRAAGRPDIPIHCGASQTMSGPGQPDVPQYDSIRHLAHRRDWPQDDAVDFMAETILARPGEVVLLTIGPMTNLARLIRQAPDVFSMLRAWVAMSGYFADEVGRSSWNVLCDPTAAAIAFAAKGPQSIQIGEDVTLRCRLPRAEVNVRFTHPQLRPVLTMAGSWFERHENIVFHDPLAAVTIFEPSVCGFAPGRIEIDESDGRTRFEPDAGGRHEVAIDVDTDAFFEAFFRPFQSR